MLIKMNINMVLDMGKSTPKWMMRVSAVVNSATVIKITAIMIISLLRRRRSAGVR